MLFDGNRLVIRRSVTSWGNGSWNPSIYRVSKIFKRWLFGISEPSTVGSMGLENLPTNLPWKSIIHVGEYTIVPWILSVKQLCLLRYKWCAFQCWGCIQGNSSIFVRSCCWLAWICLGDFFKGLYFVPWQNCMLNHNLGEYVWNLFQASHRQIQVRLCELWISNQEHWMTNSRTTSHPFSWVGGTSFALGFRWWTA